MFEDKIKKFSPQDYLEQAEKASVTEVRKVLSQKKLRLEDFALLLSEAASQCLEEMAHKAQEKTLRRFGYTMSLYTPLYLSNECVNRCVYCSFNHDHSIHRKTLSQAELREECRQIKKEGFEHILLVSGESPQHITTGYLADSVAIAKEFFKSVAIEVYPLEEEEYRLLKERGLDGVTLYQETYQQKLYANYHPAGPKARYGFRLNTMDRAGRAGIKKLNIGSLLGLNYWQEEALFLAFHLNYLKKTYWQSEIALSFPRIRENAGHFQAPFPVSDRQLVQMILAFRIFDENLNLLLSTRESEPFRNGCMKLGITSISAGSRTNPGGYSGKESGTQFQISDKRSPQEISNYLQSIGYDPVWKDWEQGI